MADDMTPFEGLLKQPPPEPKPDCITAGLILLGTVLLLAFCVIGIITTIGWVAL